MGNRETKHKDDWEEVKVNRELRKILGDTCDVDLIRQADITTHQKYEHLDSVVSLLDRIRAAIARLKAEEA